MPPGQPAGARPLLLLTAALAGLAYGWGMGGASVETFYGAAARSMSQSWHDFIFGSFDPAGTVTVDKLPGALWMQALSLRLFGLPVRPASPDPRLRWIEAHCAQGQLTDPLRPVQYAYYHC